MENNPRVRWNKSYYEKGLGIIQSYLLLNTTNKDVLEKYQAQLYNTKYPAVVGKPNLFYLYLAKADYPSYAMKYRKRFQYKIPMIFTAIPAWSHPDADAAVLSGHIKETAMLFLSIKGLFRANDIREPDITNEEDFLFALRFYETIFNHESVHLIQILKDFRYGRAKKNVGVPGDFIQEPYELKAYLENLVAAFIVREIDNEYELLELIEMETYKFKDPKFKKQLIKDFMRWLHKEKFVFYK